MYNDNNLLDLLKKAKTKDSNSIIKIIKRFKPLLIKYSIINGQFNDDLYQELNIRILKCINNFEL